MKNIFITSLLFLSIISTNCFAQAESQIAERHEFARRGTHEKELSIGDYVIAATFKTEVNAKQYTEELHKAGFSEATYGYLSVKQQWLIYLTASDDVEKAKKERDKYREQKMFKDAWILTVHN